MGEIKNFIYLQQDYNEIRKSNPILFNVKYYKSMSTNELVAIPGRLSGNLTEEQLISLKQHNENSRAKLSSMNKSNNLTSSNLTSYGSISNPYGQQNVVDMNNYNWIGGVDPYLNELDSDPINQMYNFPNPYVQPHTKRPNPFEDYKKYGGPGSNINNTRDYEKTLADFLKTPIKSPLQQMLEELFDEQERKEFLIHLGYILTYVDDKLKVTKKASNGDVTFYSETVDQIFFKEMSIKLKVTLLSKNTLKLKIS